MCLNLLLSIFYLLVLQVNRLLPHIETGLVPADMRQMNGLMKKDSMSKMRQSVEGFLNYAYNYLAAQFGIWLVSAFLLNQKVDHPVVVFRG